MKSELEKSAAPGRAPLHDWIEDRLEVDAVWRALFQRQIPFGVNWLYTLGFATIALFGVLALTGTVLALYYAPTPDHAYESVEYVMSEVPYGYVIRGIHHWAASGMVVAVVLHLLVVFGMGAYKYPREVTWGVGVVLLLLTFGSGFTGYLLPWDEKAYWATTVGTNMAGTIPAIGGVLIRVLRGGAELGALTLTRFYAAHVLLLPMGLVSLVAVHLFFVIRQGVSVPPGMWDAKRRILARFNGNRGHMFGSASEEYHHLYGRFKTLGRPFFPDLIVEDAIVSVLVVLLVVAIAILVGAPLGEEADPTNTAFVPRPEWYFMFLFEALKYFPGKLEWVGVIGLLGLPIVVLFALPWIDRSVLRSPRDRRASVGIGAAVILAVVLLTVRAFATTPASSEAAAPLTVDQRAGRRLALAQNCMACHVIKGRGSDAGPALDGINARQDAKYISDYMENPKSLNPEAEMPPASPPLTRAQIEQITSYLLTLPPSDDDTQAK